LFLRERITTKVKGGREPANLKKSKDDMLR